MRRNHLQVAASAALVIAVFAASLPAQETTAVDSAAKSPAPRQLRYFRVEVPADHESDWPLFGFEPHRFPIERTEFDRLLAALKATPARATTTGPRMVSLQGQVKLTGDTLFGNLQATIESTATERSLLSLEGANFAIASAKWEDGRQVDIGATPDGTPVVVVEQGGKLLLEWSLRGTRGADELVRFDLHLPRCQNSRLEVAASRDVAMSTTRGLLSEQPAADDEWRHWLLELGSLPRTQLVVGTPRPTTTGQTPWIAKQRCQYSVDTEGLRLETDISLHPMSDIPTSGALKLHADLGLRIVGAAIDGSPVAWESSTTSGVEQIVLSLESSAATSAARKISLVALGEFPIGAQQALPSVRPQDVVWQSGQATVTVAAPLEITAIKESGGRIAEIFKTNGNRAATVDYFDPAGRLAIACTVPAAQLAVRSTYVWRFSPDGIEARLFADLTTAAGAIYEVTTPIAPGWEIDERDVRAFSTADVEMGSPIAESRIDIRREELQITLETPITRQRPVRLEITGRRKIDTHRRPLTMAELLFARIRSNTTSMPIGIATTTAPQRVRVASATAVARVARDTIAPAALAWIPASAVSSAFVVEESLGEQSIEIVRDPPRIDVDVDMSVAVTRPQLTETYDIQVRPDTSGVDRLRINFWPPRSEPLAWTTSTAQELPVLEFRRISAGETAAETAGANSSDAPEVWEVKFHERQSAPLVLHATRSSNMAGDGPTRITFAAVEEATEQQGRIVLRSPPGVPLQVTNRKLRAVAAPAGDDAAIATRGAYRFEPARVLATGDASLSVAPTATVPNAWAWQLLVDSQMTSGEEQVHNATWLVQNEGVASLRMQMPAGSHRRAVEIDGRAVELQDDGKAGLIVPLPPMASLVRLRVEYTSTSTPLKSWGRRQLSHPQIDLPVLRAAWHVALPDGYVQNDALGPSVGERLFGAWYRNADETANLPPAIANQLRALHDRLRQPHVTWGQALLDYQLAPAAPGQQPAALWIDSLAVAEAGLQQQSRVHSDGAIADSLESLLSQANLSLLVTSRAIVLTSLPVARLYRQAAMVHGESPIVRINDGPLAANFDEPQLRFSEFVTPQIWASPHAPARSSLKSRGDSFAASSLATRQVLELTPPDSSDLTVTVYRRDWLAGLRVAMMLLALGLAWLTTKWRASLLAAACLLAGAVAVLATTPIAVAASGVFLGLLLGAVVRLLQRSTASTWQAPTSREGSTATVAHVATLLLFALGLATWSPCAAADEKRIDTPFPVWIPVDEKQQPTGDVYLPKAFYDELRERARAAAQSPRGWLLLGASYHLRLGWQGTPTMLQPEELSLVFDIDVAASSPQIIIPLPRAGLELGDSWALLDGEPLELGWREGESGLHIPIPTPGKHRLELRVQPTIQSAESLAVLDLAVPRSFIAQLQITAPFDAPAMQIDQSQGAIQFSDAVLPLPDGSEEKVKRWHAELGQIERLQVTWPLATTTPAPPVEFTVDEVAWLDLTGEPRIDVKFRCEIKRGTLRELVVTAPAELKLLPAVAKWELLPSPSKSFNAYRFSLERPADKEFVARIAFQLPGAATLGRMLVPQIHVRGVQSIQRSLLAISPPSNLSVAQDAALRPITAEEFLRRWSENAAAPPPVIFQIDPLVVAQLLLQPVTIEPQSRDHLQVKLSLNEAWLELTADLEPIAAGRQLYEFALPEGFLVQSVAVAKLPKAEADPAEESSTNLLRWWSIDSRMLRLFLEQPATTRHQIRIAGAMPHVAGKILLPMIRLNNVKCSARTVEIQCNMQVDAQIVETRGYDVGNEADPVVGGANARHIASLIDSSPATNGATCTLELNANQPRVSGRQVTSILRNDENWLARVDIDLQVAEGLVDIVRVQLPPDFGPDVLLEPALAHRVVTGPDGGGRELLIFPREPIADEFQVTLQGPCPTSAGQNLQVPDLRVRDVSRLDRFIVVPKAIDRQNIQWQVDRLLALSDDRRRDVGLADSETIVYRVVSDPFHAEMRALRHVAGVPLVRLADLRFATDLDGSSAGWASFDLEPAGLSHCTVAVPAHYRLVQIRTGEMPAQTQPISPQRWRIALRPQGMPQRIEVFYRGMRTASSTKQITASAPAIEDIAVERTTWTIYGPPRLGVGVPQTGGEISPLQQDLLRLRSLTEIMRLPRHLRLESTVRETRDWFQQWDRRWQIARRAVVRAELQSPNADERLVLADLPAIDEDRAKIIADLGLATASMDDIAEVSPFCRFTVPPGQVACRTMVQGSNPTQTIEYPEAQSNGAAVARWGFGLLLAAAGISLLLARRWLPTTDWPLRSGRAIGVLVGIAWALWLWPAWMGWAIVVLFLWPQSWPARKRTTVDTDSDIVVRSASGHASL